MDKGTEVAWAAGLFEGEGCWNFFERPKRGKTEGTRSQVQARLGMTDRDVVERFAEIVGVGNIYDGRKIRPNEKPFHEWAVYGFEKVQHTVALFWPYLGDRRKAKAREVLAASRNVQAKRERPNCPKGHPYSGENLKREQITRNGRVYFARRCRVCRNDQERRRHAA